MKVAILGWGSLLWDARDEFDEQHYEWQFDGPILKLEFSRISQTRSGALTLVLDSTNGRPCQVAYALSRRTIPGDTIADLRSREGTATKNIGCYFLDGSSTHGRDPEVLNTIAAWASDKKIDVTIWTDLASNFREKGREKSSFTIERALNHLKSLDERGGPVCLDRIFTAISGALRGSVIHGGGGRGSVWTAG